MNSDQQRAVYAQSLLDNEILQEAFDTMKEQFIKEWSNTSVTDVQRREDAWRMLKVIDKVNEHLRYLIANEKLKNDNITKLKSGILG